MNLLAICPRNLIFQFFKISYYTIFGESTAKGLGPKIPYFLDLFLPHASTKKFLSNSLTLTAHFVLYGHYEGSLPLTFAFRI